MKTLLAFAIGLMILFPVTVVIGMAIAEEGEQVDENPAPPLINSTELWPGPQEPGAYYYESIDEWGNIWRVAYFVNEDGRIYTTGIPYRVDENGNPISDDIPPKGLVLVPSSEQQPSDPLSDPFGAFNKIPGVGIPDMFIDMDMPIDMDNIFSNIDISTWQPNKLPEPVWISPDELPPMPVPEPVIINFDDAIQIDQLLK